MDVNKMLNRRPINMCVTMKSKL